MQMFGALLAVLMVISGAAGMATANDPPPMLIDG